MTFKQFQKGRNKMEFKSLNDGNENLNLMKDMYRLRIKTTLAMIQKMNFEGFLKKYLEFGPRISPGELFQNGIWDCLLAVEHAVNKKDTELLDYINQLIEKLESEGGDEENIPLGRIFAKLLMKAKNVCEAGLPIPGIIITFEFKYFLEAFKERIIKKMFATDKRNDEEFYNSITHYSNN